MIGSGSAHGIQCKKVRGPHAALTRPIAQGANVSGRLTNRVGDDRRASCVYHYANNGERGVGWKVVASGRGSLRSRAHVTRQESVQRTAAVNSAGDGAAQPDHKSTICRDRRPPYYVPGTTPQPAHGHRDLLPPMENKTTHRCCSELFMSTTFERT